MGLDGHPIFSGTRRRCRRARFATTVCRRGSPIRWISTPTTMSARRTRNVYAANPGHVDPGEVVKVEIGLHNPGAKRTALSGRAPRSMRSANLPGNQPDAQDQPRLRPYAALGPRREPDADAASKEPLDVATPLPPRRRDRSARGRPCRDRLRACSLAIEDFRLGRFEFQARRRLKVVKTKYVGLEAVRAAALSQAAAVAAGDGRHDRRPSARRQWRCACARETLPPLNSR